MSRMLRFFLVVPKVVSTVASGILFAHFSTVEYYVFRPAFRCCKHHKAGRNTQQLLEVHKYYLVDGKEDILTSHQHFQSSSFVFHLINLFGSRFEHRIFGIKFYHGFDDKCHGKVRCKDLLGSLLFS